MVLKKGKFIDIKNHDTGCMKFKKVFINMVQVREALQNRIPE